MRSLSYHLYLLSPLTSYSSSMLGPSHSPLDLESFLSYFKVKLSLSPLIIALSSNQLPFSIWPMAHNSRFSLGVTSSRNPSIIPAIWLKCHPLENCSSLWKHISHRIASLLVCVSKILQVLSGQETCIYLIYYHIFNTVHGAWDIVGIQ